MRFVIAQPPWVLAVLDVSDSLLATFLFLIHLSNAPLPCRVLLDYHNNHVVPFRGLLCAEQWGQPLSWIFLGGLNKNTLNKSLIQLRDVEFGPGYSVIVILH